ncbi:MAG: hypothetical protein GF411_07535 [Candidatus Lokiarchaeota archaeon]|nr:hypothetical protein [Candidatus Lokiarchaeota archaeon]
MHFHKHDRKQLLLTLRFALCYPRKQEVSTIQDFELTNWLVNNAGTTVKFRTLIDILDRPDIGEVGRTFSVLEMDPAIVELVEAIPNEINSESIHSASLYAFENIMGILFQMGIRAGMQLFDLKTLPYRVWLKRNNDPKSQDCQIVSAFLSLTGYGSIRPVQNMYHDRLGDLNKNPQNISIYDVIGLSHMQTLMKNEFTRNQIEEIVFQVCKEVKKNEMSQAERCDYLLSSIISKVEKRQNNLLLILELLAPLWIIQESKWFRKALGDLESYRTPKGTYLFPECMLSHKEEGFWINGDFMAMDLHERTKAEIECESTFRMLRIRQLSGLLRTR